MRPIVNQVSDAQAMVGREKDRSKVCPECRTEFSPNVFWKQHNCLHEILQPLSCSKCDRRFETLQSEKRHKKTCPGHPEDWKPSYCTGACASEALHGPKVSVKSPANRGPREASLGSSLKAIPVNAPQIPNCKLCDLRLDKPLLKRHYYLAHLGQLSFCQTCGKGFAQADDRDRHAEDCKHAPRPFCDRCGTQFSAEGPFHTHSKVCALIGADSILKGDEQKRIQSLQPNLTTRKKRTQMERSKDAHNSHPVMSKRPSLCFPVIRIPSTFFFNREIVELDIPYALPPTQKHVGSDNPTQLPSKLRHINLDAALPAPEDQKDGAKEPRSAGIEKQKPLPQPKRKRQNDSRMADGLGKRRNRPTRRKQTRKATFVQA